MNRFAIAVGLLIASSTLSLGAFAQEHHEEHGGGEQHAAPPQQQQHAQAPQQHGGQMNHGPVRQAPPPFQAHNPGVHPQGAHYQNHPVRVLSPHVVVRGRATGWNHWEHPDFQRPIYYWSWGHIRSVSCIAEDSYGDQYPVTESAWSGFGINDMTTVEDNALDRCHSESGNDDSCYLATCSHY